MSFISKGPSKMEMGFPRPFIRFVTDQLNMLNAPTDYIFTKFFLKNGKSTIRFFGLSDMPKRRRGATESYRVSDKNSVAQETELQLLWSHVNYSIGCELGIEQTWRPAGMCRNYTGAKVYPLTQIAAADNYIDFVIHESRDWMNGDVAVMSSSSKNKFIDKDPNNTLPIQ